MFTVRMGIPEMEEFWDNFENSVETGTASKDEIKLYNKIGKTLAMIAKDPRYPGLNSHEITELTARYGHKVWTSYMENRKPAAGRIYWAYGPGRGDITIVAIEPHPDDKSNAYKKITLSAMGEVMK